MSSRQPADAEARATAASDFTRNLVVQAGAGSGKTSLLVERALQALARGLVQPSQLAAITFTEKAAAEMLVRLASGLDDLRALAAGQGDSVSARSPAARAYPDLIQNRAVDDTTIQQRATAALQQLHRLPVKTLHTFCADILRSCPRASGVDPSFVVDQGEKRRLLFEQEWTRFLAAELGADAPRQELWQRLLPRMPVPRLTEMAEKLATFKVPLGLLSPGNAHDQAWHLIQPTARRMAEALNELRRLPGPLTPLHARVVDGMRVALHALHEEGFTACRQVLLDDKDLAARIYKSDLKPSRKADKAFKALFAEAIRAANGLLRLVARADATLSRDVIAALAPFVRSFRSTYLRAGHVDFDGLLTITRDVLLRHPEVRESVRRRYRMLLVDEFQDTDPVQYDIVLLLTEEDGGKSPDPYTAALAPGRLFIVGDPKQSIYRFRGADYASFKRAVDRVIGQEGQALNLTVNFRSAETLLGPVNGLFQNPSVWTASPYQPEYQAIHAHGADHEKNSPPGVEMWTVASEASQAPQRRQDEGEALAAGIRLLVADSRFTYGGITILFRAFTNVEIYLRALRRAGIPFVVDGSGGAFDERREVEDLVAILRTLARPQDPIALLAFLRSPVGGVPDTELSTYSGGGGTWRWKEGDLPGEDELPRLRSATALLRRMADETSGMPADGVISHVLRHSPLLHLSAAAHEGAQKVANLRRLASQAMAVARDGSLTLEAVVDVLQDSGRTDLESDSALADENEEAVRIMTVHKAKGLENDVVIVPDLGRRDRNPSRASIAAEAPSVADGSRLLALDLGDYCSPEWVWHKTEEQHHGQAEEMRVLYVALTRPRHRLVLMTTTGTTGGTWLKSLASWGYDLEQLPDHEARIAGGRVLHRILPAAPASRNRREEALPDTDAAVAAWEAAGALLRRTARPLLRLPSGLHEEQSRHREQESWTDHDITAAGTAAGAAGRAIGTLLHLTLEKALIGDADDLRRQFDRYLPQVADQCGVDPGQLKPGAGAVLDAFIDSPLHRRLQTTTVLGRELPLLLRGGDGVTWQGSLDLLLQEEGGQVHVVDFKTDQEAHPEALERAYGDQLAVYAAAVMGALHLPEPPLAELWLLRSGVSLTVPVAKRMQRLKLGPSGG